MTLMNKKNIEIPHGLKKILIQSKKNVFSSLAGRNISKFKGSGLDFADLKEYSYGSDIKFIDWIISAKHNTLIIKEFYEEKELDIKIFAMYGASMYFGSCELKSNILLKIVSFLGFLSVKNTDLLSIYNASNECELLTKPTKNMHIVEECLRKLYDFNPLGKKVNFDNMVYQIRKTIKRKSMIFFVGDFIGDYDFSKISNKHEIICIIIRDRLEENIFTANNIDYLNPQTLDNNKISINQSTKERYSQMIKNNDDNIKKNMHKNKITYLKIYTDEDPYIKLIKFLR